MSSNNVNFVLIQRNFKKKKKNVFRKLKVVFLEQDFILMIDEPGTREIRMNSLGKMPYKRQ